MTLPFSLFALRHARATAAALWCCLAAPLALAQPAASPAEGAIAHTVQPGDTLEGLARLYLAAPQQWRVLQSHNAIAQPRRLQPGSVLYIPAHLLPSAPASVEFVQGDVQATAPAPSVNPPAAERLQVGAALPEGTRLQVGSESFVVVRLADGSLLRVAAQSDVNLRQMRRKGRAGSLQSVIDMHGGSVEAVVPTTTDPARRLEIRTPRAATSVRGTQFGVALSGSGNTSTSVLEGSVAVQARGGVQSDRSALLQPGEGVAVSADGALGTVQPLLPAPDLSAVPPRLGDAALVHLALAPQPGALAYQVQLAPETEPLQVLRNGVFEGGEVRFQALPDGRYLLAVRALDGAGIPGRVAQQPLTIKTQPVAPLYQSPAPGATIPSSGETLRCTGVAGVQWYHLQVARTADFAAPLRDAARQPQCQLDTGALPVGTYHWRVASVGQQADGSPDAGPFAAPQAFTVAERPTAVAPGDLTLQTNANSLQLYWPGLPGQSYRLQCARDPAFADIVCDTLLDQPQWRPTGLAAGRYFVRLQTLDASGLRSDFSAARHIDLGAGVQSGSGGGVTASDGQPIGLH